MKRRKPAATPSAPLPAKRAVIYARVSSKEQEKEGYSIPAQLKLLESYAAAEGVVVAERFVDVETAKQAGRAAFGEMASWLRRNPDVRVLLVEKTDRLYRNLKDWVTIDELDVEVHLPKEGVVLSRDSRSSEKFVHGIKVLMAKNYIDNLSEEARKGQQEKAEQGVWPTKAPLGYKNVTGPDGRKAIAVDPETAPFVQRAFERYATGRYALKELGKLMRADGFVYPRSGNPIPTSTLQTILRNRLYSGWFTWNGKLYEGKHEALVGLDLWERVQDALDGRNARKHRRMTHDFAFSGLMTCAQCGSSIVGEIKKGKYIYYHCTGHAAKKRGETPTCAKKYVREEVLEERFSTILGRLRFDDEVLDWVREALRSSHADARREHREAVQRLEAERRRLGERINLMYIDKLDGKIGGDFYDAMALKWRAEQQQLLEAIGRHERAEQNYLDEGVKILELAQRAQALFERQSAQEKRRLLDVVLSNCVFDQGELTVFFRQPFDLLANSIEESCGVAVTPSAKSAKNEIWLGNLDSNQD